MKPTVGRSKHEGCSFTEEEMQRMDAWRRAANYLSVCQVYLLDNPLRREPLRQEMRDRRIEHRQYITLHGEDMPEVRDWTWPY
jgi:phosphoketolase